MSDTSSGEKTKKLTDETHENPDRMAIISPNERSPPKIFKLNIDCLSEVFEYLSLKDLYSFGQTCKALQKVAGVYFKQNYSESEKWCHKNGIYHNNSTIEVSGFNRFMPCVSSYSDYDQLNYFQSHIDEFDSTKHIHLRNFKLKAPNVEFIKKILPKIEVLQLTGAYVYANIHELMLKFCENLKCICLQNIHSSKSTKNIWITQHYPMLEHLELIPVLSPNAFKELNTFFERNPQVRRFSTSTEFLFTNSNLLFKSTAKLDILEIKEDYIFLDFSKSWNTLAVIGNFLTRLHEQGFYIF